MSIDNAIYCVDCGKKEIHKKARCKACHTIYHRMEQRIISKKKAGKIYTGKIKKPKYCKLCGKRRIEKFGLCAACRKIAETRKRNTVLKKLSAGLQKKSWNKTFPFITRDSKTYIAVEMPEDFRTGELYEKDVPTEIIDKTGLELSKEYERAIAFFELLIIDKALELVKDGKLRSLDYLKNVFDSKIDNEKLFSYYTSIKKVEKEEEDKIVDMEDVKPYPHEIILSPEQDMYIARCCATCKHYQSLKTVYSELGFCKFGKADPKIPLIQLSYKERPPASKIKEVVEDLKKIFPPVHPMMDCDNYVKTTSKTRLRGILRLLKTMQEQVNYRVDVK